jgi:hypothetical protein
MSADRVRLWTLVVEQALGAPVTIGHVGAVTVTTAGVDAAGVTVTLAASPRESLYSSGQIAADMEDLTTTLGEGPGIDAVSGGPVLAADLSDAWCQLRWPLFGPAAVDVGVLAVFALPLRIGGIRLGVMDLYRVRPGALDGGQLADALLLADTVCALLLDIDIRAGGRQPEGAGLQHPEVHQATGMVIAQLGVSAAVALIRLRAYAYSHDQRLRDVAADVVGRRLRFRPERLTDTEGD